MNLTDLKQKITLGTVQLGLSYGINNHSGKPDEVEAHRILDKATTEKISLLDSAESYGDSLRVIGSYLKKNRNSSFRVISKFIGDQESLKNKVDKALLWTGQVSLYALMYHRFSDYESGLYRKDLLELKEAGKIRSIGISLYSEKELEMSLYDPEISVIQIPFNPFDASPNKKSLMEIAKAGGKEIHVRSIFLQGLFFKKIDELGGNLKEFAEPLEHLQSLIARNGKTIREACLNYALHQPFIDRVIIGVETTTQLEENVRSVMAKCPEWILNELEVDVQDKLLLNPAHWKP